jgi:hypothetical protein
MLKVLLSGIAGVTTAYALKKYLEEEECYCTQYEDVESGTDAAQINLLEPLDAIKQKLNKTLFRKTEALSKAIENLIPNTLQSFTIEPNTIQTLKNTPENEAEINEFCHILTHAEYVQHELLDELIKPLFEIDNANQLKGEEKVKATRFIDIDTLMREACTIEITLNGESISPLAKITFQELLMYIDAKQSE